MALLLPCVKLMHWVIGPPFAPPHFFLCRIHADPCSCRLVARLSAAPPLSLPLQRVYAIPLGAPGQFHPRDAPAPTPTPHYQTHAQSTLSRSGYPGQPHPSHAYWTPVNTGTLQSRSSRGGGGGGGRAASGPSYGGYGHAQW